MAELDAEEHPPVLVYDENRAALDAFLAVRTQWAVGPNGPTGLDYARAERGWRLSRIRMSPALFADVQVMERAALEAFAEAAEEARGRRGGA